MAGIDGYQRTSQTFNIRAFGDYLDAQRKRLPSLSDVQHVSPRIIRVLGQNPGEFTLQGTNTYIVGTGHDRILIDAGQGYPLWADKISTTIKSLGISLTYVLLTHWHSDHTGGVPDLVRMYPHLSSSIHKNSPSPDQQNIVDGQTFRVEGATIRALFTPGHAFDHMCFVLEEDNAMFTGDNILGHGTTVFEDLGLLMSSWREMLSHNCTRGYPGHGDVIEALSHRISGQLAAKTRREKLILTALQRARGNPRYAASPRRESVTTAQLVLLMHGETVNQAIRTLALEPLTDEVLRKLADDGMVGFEVRDGGKRWFRLLVD